MLNRSINSYLVKFPFEFSHMVYHIHDNVLMNYTLKLSFHVTYPIYSCYYFKFSYFAHDIYIYSI